MTWILATVARAPRWAWYGIAVVAAVAAFMLWLRIHDNAIRADQKALDQAAYAEALSEAEMLAYKANADAEAHYRRLADEADRKADIRIADARTAADRYIARMRVTREGAPSSTSASPGGGSAEGAERSDPLAELVAVTADDIHICTENTARLIEAKAWADGISR